MMAAVLKVTEEERRLPVSSALSAFCLFFLEEQQTKKDNAGVVAESLSRHPSSLSPVVYFTYYSVEDGCLDRELTS